MLNAGASMGNAGTKRLFAMLATTEILASSVAHGGPFDFGGSMEQRLDGSVLKSEISIDLSAIRSPVSGPFGLGTFTGSSDAVRSFLDDRGLHPYLGMKKIKVHGSDTFGLTSGSSQVGVVSDYQFHAGAYPLCGVTFRTIQQNDGSTVVVGNIPIVDQVGSFSDSDWPDQIESARVAIEGVAQNQNLSIEGAKVHTSSRCLMNEQGSLEPVWNFIVSLSGFQFDVWSTPWRIANANQRFMDATATIRAYDPNQTTGTLKDFSVTVSGDGTMTNDFFTTADYSGAARSTSTTNNFVYSGTSDSQFAEASTFAYVNQQYDFVKSMGYTWVGMKPIKVITHAIIGNTTNNALYTPSDGTSAPTIKVGDGDGSTLQNLPYDADVVSHEFGHHVIYQSVTVIGGESLVLHEGLADFLAMSRTSDSCLGESICPESSSLCQVKSKCLRSADNTISYNDAKYLSFGSSAHLKGQLISGLMWDLRKNNAIPADTLTRYMLEAIPYFPSNASFKSLVAALLYVDQKHSSTYQTAIVNAATTRGLSPSSLGIDLTSLQSSIAATATTSSDESSSKKGGFLGCGTIGSGFGAQQGSTAWLVLILFVLPVILRIKPKKLVPIPVKSKRNS